jgi:hypothetical protein
MAVIDWFLMYLTFRRSVRLISGLRNRPDAGSREAVAVARTAVAPSVETGSGETVPEAATEPEAATVPAATSRTWA